MSVLGSLAGRSTAQSGAAPGYARFNADAASWDSNPLVSVLSNQAWVVIQRLFPSLFPSGRQQQVEKPTVLEIGCGTGLLTLLMADSCKRIVAVDAAEGMIQVLSSKLEAEEAPTNVTPLAILLEDPEDARLPPASNAADPSGPRLKFDLITSHLALHHIPEIEPLLRTMLGSLKPGGFVALTDFEDFGPDAQRFHPEARMEGVERHGINKEWMAGLMKQVGFENVRVEVGWRHEKTVERFPGEFGEKGRASQGQGQVMEFPYVVCMGRRQSP